MATTEQLKEQTDWYGLNTPNRIRQLLIDNNYTAKNMPKCCCGNFVSYDKVYRSKFNQFCCNDCSKKYRQRLQSNTIINLSNYNWLYNERITQQKSFEQIASDLNCSVTPIKIACKKLKIPAVKHNQSNSLVLTLLRDKDWLIDQHIKQRKTLEQIASEIKSSPATISRWLQKHKIIANAANSYPRKFNHISKEQKSIVDYIKSLGIENIIENDRSLLHGSEIDILLPDFKLAIEYNGVYSHIYRPEQQRESAIKGPSYHLNKTQKCAEQGYQLIHIFSDDWISKPNIIKSIIANKLGKSSRIYARSCTIKSVDKNQKALFLNQNHIQGNDKSTINYGLFLGNQLVALCTFGKSRYNNKYQWELVRFCNALFQTVVGGFSRLLTHFEREHSGSIISYADRTRSNGDVYLKNGFTQLKINPPSYSYINLNIGKRMHRSNFMKSKISTTTDNRTEFEIMQELGYHKIYDCGTLTYVKD